MNKKVGILTTFGSWDNSYSPCNVVSYQIQMLLKHGYEPVLYVLDCFPQEITFEGVEIRRVLPTLAFEPYQGIASSRMIPPQFEKDVARVMPAMEQNFKDVDIFLCHDIIFQDSFLPYNAALRKIVLRKEQRFLHWTHSGPSSRPKDLLYPLDCLYTLPPQSRLVYMNGFDTVRIAEMYATYTTDVRVVHNPIDYLGISKDALFRHIVVESNINEADVIAVYPLSTTRMGAGGKQLHKAIKIMGYIKQLGYSVRFIIPNAHANAEREKAAIEEMLSLGEQYGLEANKDLIFTSKLGASYESGIAHETVLELFGISDVFLFPSISENAPLILLEAALKKNLLVLNEDFSPMKDFVGANALYLKFDSVNTMTNHEGIGGEDNYYKDVAKIIIAELEASKSYKAHRDIRKKFNMDYIFKHELEPAMMEGREISKTAVEQDISQESIDKIEKRIAFGEYDESLIVKGAFKVEGNEYKENEQKEDFPDFDKVYKRFKEKGIMKDPVQIKMYEAISRNWCIGKAVIDAGCGMGIGTNILGREALGAWGVDSNAENIEVAKQLFEGMTIKFETVDLLKEHERPFGSFDVVVCIEVIEHVKDFDLLLNGLKKFYNPKRRTIFFISSPNRNSEKLGHEHPNNEWHVREWTSGEAYEVMTKHFESVVMYSAEKLDTFDQSETVDGNTKDTPVLFKCEVPK